MHSYLLTTYSGPGRELTQMCKSVCVCVWNERPLTEIFVMMIQFDPI